MAAMTRPLFLASFTLVVMGCSGRSLTFPGFLCEPLNDVYGAVIAATHSRQLDSGFLRVPVVLHLMTDPADPIDRRPEKYWTPDFVGKYLGVGDFSINQVWARTKIHFDLERVERCYYKPPSGTFNLLASGAKGMFPPDVMTLRERRPEAQQLIIDHYLDLNADYGISRALNIFLWRNIYSGINGYGESPRRHRPEVRDRQLEALSTVWYESWLSCGSMPEGGDDCQLSLAHEVGHALGLSHSCFLCGPQPEGGTCCTDLCWASGTDRNGLPTDYYFTCQAEDTGGVRWNNWCACEGTPGDVVSRGLTACGEPFVCCRAHENRHRLMFPKAGKHPASGFEFCGGEVHSARSGVREFFHNQTGGADGQAASIRRASVRESHHSQGEGESDCQADVAWADRGAGGPSPGGQIERGGRHLQHSVVHER